MSNKNKHEYATQTIESFTNDVEEVYSKSELENEPTVDEVEPEPIIGVVTGCIKLNVRKEPDAKAAVISEIANSTEVIIDESGSTEEFYKVCTAIGVEGFCMKKFVTVKQ